jgi:hypothetical protein
MKLIHFVAIACFAIAIACYSMGGRSDLVGGFTVLGFFFETIGWKNMLSR